MNPSARQRQFGTEELPTALGTVRGVREWMPIVTARRTVLYGMNHCAWRPGENVAQCLAPLRPHEHARPKTPECGLVGLDCTCGFYAYWDLDAPAQPVVGVIEGWGRTVIGPKGFRCERARILGLTLVVPIVRNMADEYGVPAYRTVEEMLASHPVRPPFEPRPHHPALAEIADDLTDEIVDALCRLSDRVDDLGRWVGRLLHRRSR